MTSQTASRQGCRLLLITLALATAGAPPVLAQPATTPESEPSLEELRRLIEEQQALLETQRQRIEEQQQRLADQEKVLAGLLTRLDQMETSQAERQSSEIALREQMQKLLEESQIGTGNTVPVEAIVAGEFPGSIKVPGTNMAFKVGGFVNGSLVSNRSNLETQDSFVTAGIPVGDQTMEAVEDRFTLSVRRTRFSFDSRMDSSLGQFRAFIEADFLGEGGTLRLRHALGQYKSLVLGQAWSTLMSPYASPEQIDLEGINGEIIVRQPLGRWRPRRGPRSAAISLEDPQPSISGGQGEAVLPDVLGRMSHELPGGGQTHLALIGRQLRAVSEEGARDSTLAWGASAGARLPFSVSGAKDTVQLQLSLGSGFGRYVNDLDAEGGQDAWFDPATAKLRPLPVAAGYVAYQHWWPFQWRELRSLRSTLIGGWVYVDNYERQPSDSYHQTLRFSLNLIWSPLAPLDIGLEYLWGQRENADGQTGTASQFQLATYFRF